MTIFSSLVLVLIGASAFAFGAVYPWAYVPLAAMAAGMGLWALTRRDTFTGARPPLVAGLVAIACAIGLQLLPLPRAVFARLAPAADRFLSSYDFAYANDPPSWHALSIAPASTAVALAEYAALALLLVGLVRVMGRLRLTHLAGGLTAIGVLLAIVALVQKAFAPPNSVLVYGFWTPTWGGSPFGPFINRNHFAGWMVMALPVVAAFAFGALEESPHPPRPGVGEWLRWLTTPDASRVATLAFCVLAMGTAVGLSGSRSGMASLVVAGVALMYFVSHRLDRPALRRLAIVAAIVLIAGAVIWAGPDRTIARFSLASRDLPTRLQAWRDTLRIVRDFPVFGIGLGTYVNAMLVYQSGAREQIFFQAHNDYLQILAEGGLLVVVPVCVALGMIVRESARRLRTADAPITAWLRRGAVAGLLGIAAQSAVEFSLQIPANALLCVVLLALALHPADTSHAHRV